jgi:nucleoporin GLE1
VPKNGVIDFSGPPSSTPLASSKNGVIGFSGPPSSTPLAPPGNKVIAPLSLPASTPDTSLNIAPTSTIPFASNQQPSTKGKEPATQQQAPNAATVASSAHTTTTPANDHPPAHHVLPHVERYSEIHKSLKEVRQHFKPGGNAQIELRKIANDRRREITKFVGQLVAVGDKSGNTVVVSALKQLP